jgi:hypothetical protein
MDYTKTKTFIAFRHVADKNRYWVEYGWVFSEESPSLYPYDTKDQKKIADEVLDSYINNWGLKDVETVIVTVGASKSISDRKKKEVVKTSKDVVAVPEKKTRKKKDADNT